MTIARGKLIKDEIKDFEILLIGKPMLTRNIHWGSRIIIHNNHLYAGFGERGLGMIAQDPSKHPGSIIRINIDGSIPKDNPSNKNKPNWLPEIYQIGVRNPQGMAISPLNQKIYFSQHGPRGGDNIGILKKGGNFGWKDVAWGGKEYYGAKIGTKPFKKKIQPSNCFLGSVHRSRSNKFLFWQYLPRVERKSACKCNKSRLAIKTSV